LIKEFSKTHDIQDGSLFTFKDFESAKIAFEKMKAGIDAKAKQFLQEIKFGKCKTETIVGQEITERFWVLAMNKRGRLPSMDNWICNLSLNEDDMYQGLGRVAEFELFTNIIEEFKIVK